MKAQAGVVLQGVDSPRVFQRHVHRIEGLGYDHLWLTDSSLHARNPYVYLALAAHQTSTITLGTAVTNPLTRHPAVTAVSIATLDELSGGRALLGLGAGDRPVEALGFTPARRRHIRAAIDAIRSLLAGETVDTDANGIRLDQAHLRFAARKDLPIFLAASGPKMLELAGEIADGVIVLSGLFPNAIRYALERVDTGARRAGRPRPHVALMAYGSIDDDVERAVAATRPIAAWFPQTAPQYCDLAGLNRDLVRRVRETYGGGEFQEAQEAAALLPVEFVQQVGLAGDRRHACAQLAPIVGLGVDSVHVFPLGDRRMDTVEAFAACWAEVTGT